MEITLHPCAKVNLGLHVTARRADGYHDIETVFYPIPLCDELTVERLSAPSPTASPCTLHLTGNPIEGAVEDNLICRAYHLLANDFPLSAVRVSLTKHIPTQAGLGGGSSDAAAMLNALNRLFHLQLDNATLRGYAAQLGADCPFFIEAVPAFATGIGEQLSPIPLRLHGCRMLLVKPDDAVSTREAYQHIVPSTPTHSCKDVVKLPVGQWQERLGNDFEASVLPAHRAIAEVMEQLHSLNAAYVQMSGSGSAVFAINDKPFREDAEALFPGCWTRILEL